MELIKNIFFNTDKLIENSKVKISYTGKFFQDASEEVSIHYGFGFKWDNIKFVYKGISNPAYLTAAAEHSILKNKRVYNAVHGETGGNPVQCRYCDDAFCRSQTTGGLSFLPRRESRLPEAAGETARPRACGFLAWVWAFSEKNGEIDQ